MEREISEIIDIYNQIRSIIPTIHNRGFQLLLDLSIDDYMEYAFHKFDINDIYDTFIDSHTKYNIINNELHNYGLCNSIVSMLSEVDINTIDRLLNIKLCDFCYIKIPRYGMMVLFDFIEYYDTYEDDNSNKRPCFDSDYKNPSIYILELFSHLTVIKFIKIGSILYGESNLFNGLVYYPIPYLEEERLENKEFNNELTDEYGFNNDLAFLLSEYKIDTYQQLRNLTLHDFTINKSRLNNEDMSKIIESIYISEFKNR